MTFIMKNNMLKELGWSDEMIRHFMIDDSEYIDSDTTDLIITVHDTDSFVVDSDKKTSGNVIIV